MSVQQGGMHPMIGKLHEVIATMDSPAKLLYGFVLVVMIVYSSLIPSEYRSFADSLLGRVFGVAVVYGVVEGLGWVYGLLTALAFLLVINGAPSTSEGFDGTVTNKSVIKHNTKWYVEWALGENPDIIATDYVNTYPTQ